MTTDSQFHLTDKNSFRVHVIYIVVTAKLLKDINTGEVNFVYP